MKRILSFIVALSLMVSLLAGISFTASAQQEHVAITGVIAAVAGQPLVTDGITGAPEGFDLNAIWSKYNYTTHSFEVLPANTVAENNAVYQLKLEIVSQGTAYIPQEDSMFIAGGTIDGEPNSAWLTTDYRPGSGYYGFAYAETFLLGGIQYIDAVTFDALPAKAAGTPADLSGVVVPANAGYSVDPDSFWRDENYNFVTTPLEDNKCYMLYLTLHPKEGYWFPEKPQVNAPEAPIYHDKDHRGMYYVEFEYELRPLVTRIDLTIPQDPQPETAIPQNPVTVPAGVKYTVQAQWTQADGEGGWEETTDTAFQFKEYGLMLTLIPAEGYTFRDDADIYINGTNLNYINDVWTDNRSATEIRLVADYTIQPENGFIWNVSLSGLPDEIAPGAAPVAPTLQVTSGPVHLTNVRWVDKDHNPVTGKLADGNLYYLEIAMEANDGYAFNEHCQVELYSNDSQYKDAQLLAYNKAVVYANYSLLPPITAANVLVTQPQIGATPAEPVAPSGAKYTVVAHQWSCEGSDEPVTKFEDGKRYYLDVTIDATEGYRFDDNVALTINGAEAYDSSDRQRASLSITYSFKKAIERVDITLPQYKQGDLINLSGIKTPEGAKYQIDTNVSNWSSYDAALGSTFGKDKYALSLLLKAAQGCEFTEDTKFYINGKLCEDFYVYDGTESEVIYEISFREVLHKIELSALPTVQVGDTATDPQVQPPAGAHYQVFAQWIVHTGGTSGESFSGAFADKTAYYLSMLVAADPGYEFAEDLEITVGDQKYTGIQIGDDKSQLLAKLYSFGLTVIDKIELTTTTPEDGKTPGALTAGKDAGYTVEDFSWGVGKEDEFFTAQAMKQDETFAYGNYYFLHGEVSAKEGYIFADNAKIYINGKAIEERSFLGMPTVMGDAALVIYEFGQLQMPVTPPTGDTSPVAALIGLMVLASAGMVTLLANKKRLAK